MLNFYEGGNPQNPAVLLLHGGFLLHRMWMPQLEPLSQRYHVLAPDLFYDDLSHLTISNLTRDIAAILEQRVGKPAYVIGLSFGAVVATQLALSHPELVKGLVVSAGRVRSGFGDQAVLVLLRLMPANRLLNSFLDATLQIYPRLNGAAQEEMQRVGKAGFLQTMSALSRVDFTPHLARIAVPALVIVGADDRPGFITDAKKLADAIPNAELRIIPDVGHGWNLEEPELFTQTVTDFVDQNEKILTA